MHLKTKKRVTSIFLLALLLSAPVITFAQECNAVCDADPVEPDVPKLLFLNVQGGYDASFDTAFVYVKAAAESLGGTATVCTALFLNFNLSCFSHSLFSLSFSSSFSFSFSLSFFLLTPFLLLSPAVRSSSTM